MIRNILSNLHFFTSGLRLARLKHIFAELKKGGEMQNSNDIYSDKNTSTTERFLSVTLGVLVALLTVSILGIFGL